MKDKIIEALESIDKEMLINSLIDRGWKRTTILEAFKRGSISKKLAPDMELLTCVSALFWIAPGVYGKDGVRK